MNSVKVIACFIGERWNFPKTSLGTMVMLHCLWDREIHLDYGCSMDTLFIYNKLPEEQIKDKENYKKCEELLYSFHNQKTKNGVCKVVERENIGISYGAFDFAFNEFKNQYDYWLFCEDDQIIIKEGVMRQCIKQLTENKKCGFVATIGVNDIRKRRVHAGGGCGCSYKDVLNKVVNSPENYSQYLKRGCLPYWYNFNPIAGGHEKRSEIIFTNVICKFGYQLYNIDMEELVVIWGKDYKEIFYGNRVLLFTNFNKIYKIL